MSCSADTILTLFHLGVEAITSQIPIKSEYMPTLFRPRTALCLVLVVAGFMATTPAFAQDGDEPRETVEATDEQARLNDQAVRAIGKEDYVKAISLLEEALYLGKLNITYLNLGRAYQLAGRCEQARRALRNVPTAPAVEKPPAGFIEAKAEEYLNELEEDCDFEDETAKKDDQTDEKTDKKETLDDDATADAETTEDKDTDPVADEDVDPPPTTDPGGSNVPGIIMTSTGGAMVLGAVGMHFLWAEPTRREVADGIEEGDRVSTVSQREYFEARDKANRIDTAALITGLSGAAVTGVGLFLWLSEPNTEGRTRFQLAPSKDGVRASWTIRF